MFILWFLIGLFTGFISAYTLFEYVLFCAAREFHKAFNVEITWKEYFLKKVPK